MKTDTLFYRLFQDRPELVFELAELTCPAGADHRWRAEEVKETAFRHCLGYDGSTWTSRSPTRVETERGRFLRFHMKCLLKLLQLYRSL